MKRIGMQSYLPPGRYLPNLTYTVNQVHFFPTTCFFIFFIVFIVFIPFS